MVTSTREFLRKVKINELKEFRRIHKNTEISRDYEEFPNLGKFVRSTRKSGKYHCSRKQQKYLEQLNYKWIIKERRKSANMKLKPHWDEKSNETMEISEEKAIQ